MQPSIALHPMSRVEHKIRNTADENRQLLPRLKLAKPKIRPSHSKNVIFVRFTACNLLSNVAQLMRLRSVGADCQSKVSQAVICNIELNEQYYRVRARRSSGVGTLRARRASPQPQSKPKKGSNCGSMTCNLYERRLTACV